jgi:hypothetical protein
MKSALEMGSGATIYVPNSTKIGSGIEKLIWRGIHRHIHKTVISYAYFYFFNIRKLG